MTLTESSHTLFPTSHFLADSVMKFLHSRGHIGPIGRTMSNNTMLNMNYRLETYSTLLWTERKARQNVLCFRGNRDLEVNA